MVFMSNPGIAPPDTSTAVGKFRVDVGDTAYVPLDPPVTGQGDYTYFSDAELQSILDNSGTGNAGMAFAYRKLAAILAIKAVSIQTDDLKVSTEQRAETLRKIAADFEGAAGNDAAGVDIFQLAGGQPGYSHVELAEYPWGCYGSAIV